MFYFFNQGIFVFQQYFYQVRPEAPAVQYGNISSRVELRKQLKCKPFSWYLKYVYPEQVKYILILLPANFVIC